MSKKPFTPATPRYKIKSVKGDFLDVFNKRANAIKAAIKMAVEYPGAHLLVVKAVNFKEKIIFSVKIDSNFEFEDVKDMYQGFADAYQKKVDKTRYWRKSDDS